MKVNKHKRFDQVEDYVEQAESLSLINNDVRRSAMNSLQEYGFPGIKTEAWKYTNVKNIVKQAFVSCEQAEFSSAAVEKHLIDGALHLVFVNGYFQEEYFVRENNGLVIEPINEGHSLYSTLTPIESPGFIALNTMINQHAYCIEINKTLEEPIQILNIVTGVEDDSMFQDRQLVIVKESVEASIIEQYVSQDDGKYWRNCVSEVFLQKHSQLSIYKTQQESLSAYHTHFRVVKQRESSILNTFTYDAGSKLARSDLNVKLMGKHAETNNHGLYLSRDSQHVDNHIDIHHDVEETVSKMFYKGVLNNDSRSVFNGGVRVLKDAQKVESEQKNANLLLSKNCEIDTKPELEIYADDVRCAHGATVGQLNNDAVFYLQSRGLSEESAKKLLTYGFAYEAIESINSTLALNLIRQLLTQWFTDEAELQEMIQ